MPSAPRIRRASAEDAAAVSKCLASAFEAYRECYTAGAFADTVPAPEGIAERLREMTILVAENDAASIVGTIGFTLHDAEAHLRGMAVIPSLHGQGVAARLLAAAEDELRARGCSSVTLDTTEPLERATAFYTRHGFRPSGRVTDFFGMRLIEYRKALGVW